MENQRTKSEKLLLVSFAGQSEWAAFRLRFNEGNKHSKPVKLQAEKEWATPGCPVAFSLLRGSYAGKSEAETSFVAQLKSNGATVHELAKPILQALEKKYGYRIA